MKGAGDVDAVLVPPTDFGLEFTGGCPNLTYTLPFAVGSRAFLEIFDPATSSRLSGARLVRTLRRVR